MTRYRPSGVARIARVLLADAGRWPRARRGSARTDLPVERTWRRSLSIRIAASPLASRRSSPGPQAPVPEAGGPRSGRALHATRGARWQRSARAASQLLDCLLVDGLWPPTVAEPRRTTARSIAAASRRPHPRLGSRRARATSSRTCRSRLAYRASAVSSGRAELQLASRQGARRNQAVSVRPTVPSHHGVAVSAAVATSAIDDESARAAWPSRASGPRTILTAIGRWLPGQLGARTAAAATVGRDTAATTRAGEKQERRRLPAALLRNEGQVST